MALTYTPTGELGSPCPEFKLPAVDGQIYASADFASAPALVVMFICNHCPYVKAVIDRIVRDANELKRYGINTVAIS